MSEPSSLSIQSQFTKPMISTATSDKLVKYFFFFCGFLTVLVLFGIFGLLVYTAFPAFKEINLIEFLTGKIWRPTAYNEVYFGIIPMLWSTFIVTLGSLTIAVPLGIGTAAYLSDVAHPKVREIAKPLVEILAGIPSVVIGFLGIVLVGPFLAKIFNIPNGLNALNGCILLAVMALPTIISISEDALNSVPKSLHDASLALGATKWQTVIKVKIPAAMSGIIAACMLGMGRAIGETMTVLMATGNAPAMPASVLKAVRTLTATIAIELGEVAYNSTHYYALFALGLVLFIMTFIINMISDVVLRRYEKDSR